VVGACPPRPLVRSVQLSRSAGAAPPATRFTRAGPSGDPPHATPASRRARELFHGLVGRRTGIVRQIGLVETIDGDAPLFHAGAQIANAHPYHGEHLGLGVGGCGLTADDALVSALCEGVERYVAASYGPSPRPLMSRAALGGSLSIDPASLLRFTEDQRAEPDFPLSPATDDTPLRWVEGRDLETGQPCFVPAFAVYLPYMLERDEPLVAVGLSTGLAAAPTLEEAMAKGLCEAVERDAMALVWVRGIAPPRVAPRLVKALAGHVLPPRDEVTAYDLTTDVGLPVFLVVCRGKGPRGALVAVGAACHPDARAALLKAAMEASQDRAYVRMLLDRDPEWAPAPDFSNVTDFALHARLYSHSEALARRGLAFLEGNVEVDPPALASAADQAPLPITAALQTPGLPGAAVDLTPPWAGPLGLRVARVVLPGLMPLHGNHTLRYLGHPRLARWAEGFPRGVLSHGRPIWPYPHPMP
jgi:ribosomal protein S12 methylthiotransferase accessory factor